MKEVLKTIEVTLTDLFLIALGAAWLVVFLPAALKAKRHTPLFTSETWRRRMQLFAAPRSSFGGRWIVAPQSSGATDRSARRALKKRQERRKRLLAVLVALVPLSLALAVAKQAWLWDVHFASYAALAIYVALLVEQRRVRAESVDKVQSLARRRTSPSPAADGYEERRA